MPDRQLALLSASAAAFEQARSAAQAESMLRWQRAAKSYQKERTRAVKTAVLKASEHAAEIEKERVSMANEHAASLIRLRHELAQSEEKITALVSSLEEQRLRALDDKAEALRQAQAAAAQQQALAVDAALNRTQAEAVRAQASAVAAAVDAERKRAERERVAAVVAAVEKANANAAILQEAAVKAAIERVMVDAATEQEQAIEMCQLAGVEAGERAVEKAVQKSKTEAAHEAARAAEKTAAEAAQAQALAVAEAVATIETAAADARAEEARMHARALAMVAREATVEVATRLKNEADHSALRTKSICTLQSARIMMHLAASAVEPSAKEMHVALQALPPSLPQQVVAPLSSRHISFSSPRNGSPQQRKGSLSSAEKLLARPLKGAASAPALGIVSDLLAVPCVAQSSAVASAHTESILGSSKSAQPAFQAENVSAQHPQSQVSLLEGGAEWLCGTPAALEAIAETASKLASAKAESQRDAERQSPGWIDIIALANRTKAALSERTKGIAVTGANAKGSKSLPSIRDSSATRSRAPDSRAPSLHHTVIYPHARASAWQAQSQRHPTSR